MIERHVSLTAKGLRREY